MELAAALAIWLPNGVPGKAAEMAQILGLQNPSGRSRACSSLLVLDLPSSARFEHLWSEPVD